MSNSIRLLFLASLMIQSAGANLIGSFTIDTSPLIGHTAGPFALEFQLNDGSGTNDGNNTAVLTEFNFGSGSPIPPSSAVGPVTGDLGSAVTMTDASFFDEFFESFAPGATLSFQINLTTNVDSGGVPDEFSFAILDSSGFEIPTLNSANAFAIIDINSSNPTVAIYSSDPSMSPNVGGPPITIAAPVFVPTAAAPELASLAMAALSLALICLKVLVAGHRSIPRRRLSSSSLASFWR